MVQIYFNIFTLNFFISLRKKEGPCNAQGLLSGQWLKWRSSEYLSSVTTAKVKANFFYFIYKNHCVFQRQEDILKNNCYCLWYLVHPVLLLVLSTSCRRRNTLKCGLKQVYAKQLFKFPSITIPVRRHFHALQKC